MILLLQDDDHVAWHYARFLIALARECDLLLVLHTCRQRGVSMIPAKELAMFGGTFVDVDLQDLAFLHHLQSFTCFTPILLLNHLTFTAALRASALDLLHHARAKLAEGDFDTSSVAHLARAQRIRYRGTLTVIV